MKHIFTAILATAIASLTLLTSCKDFLQRNPTDVVDPNSTIDNTMAIALTNACYKALQSSNMYNMRLWSTDIIASNSIVGAGGGTDGLETIQAANFICNSNNDYALYIWRSPWVGIGRCNIVLQSLPDADISEEVKERCMGEAYFIRSHCYYILVRLFGGVPLRLEPYNPGESTDIARESLEDCYKQIILDTKMAIELLPAKDEYSGKDVGRACKEAALCQLADIYLTLAQDDKSLYNDVVSLCTQIENLGYDLSTCDFAENFDATVDNGAESLFEIQYDGSTQYDFWGSDSQMSWASTFMGPRNSNIAAGCYGWNQPTEEFMSQWEEGDLRKDVTVFYAGCPPFDGFEYKPSWSNTGYNVRKFIVSKSVSPEWNTNPNNWVVYRFADVLLKKAEALNELGQTSDAATFINKVRTRAGLPNLSGLSQAEMREAIIHERRMELAFEGHRWFDILRIDHGQYALNFFQSIGKTNVTLERLLLPIPQVEMDANSLMTQNPGY